MKNYHFICEVFDTINKNAVVMSRYCDATTFKKAVDYFNKLPEIKRYKRADYKIRIRANPVTLWDGE